MANRLDFRETVSNVPHREPSSWTPGSEFIMVKLPSRRTNGYGNDPGRWKPGTLSCCMLGFQMTFSCKWLPLCLLSDYFLRARAVSIVNSSKLTHLLLFISLCLSWILLPVFEALQWADDCLGPDYYTNLSTLSAKPSALGACVCVSVCVSSNFITQCRESDAVRGWVCIS